MTSEATRAVEDAFFCAKHAVQLLHSRMQELRTKASEATISASLRLKVERTLRAYVQLVETLHSVVRAFLLQLTSPNAASTLLEAVAEVAEEVPGLEAVEQGRASELADLVRRERAAKLAEDAQALRRAAQALLPGAPVRLGALERVLRGLGAEEQSLGFHARLAKEVAERFGGPNASGQSTKGGDPREDRLPYSDENFAYGSTPYASWLQVVSAAGTALTDALSPPGRQYIVYGSSCGWLVLYGALSFGWPSRGVEILRCLHECAERVAADVEAAEGGPIGASFVCGDLLDDDASAAGLVLLTDQCWDAGLQRAAAAKLARELPAGALVVSYSGMQLEALRLEGVEGSEGRGKGKDEGLEREGGRVFELLAAVRVPVSWADSQLFRVFRRV